MRDKETNIHLYVSIKNKITYDNLSKCNFFFIRYTYLYYYYIFQLLELYASGKLKPGLNIPVENDKILINNIVSIRFNYYNYKSFN